MINLNLPSNSIGTADVVASRASVQEAESQKVTEMKRKLSDTKGRRMVVQLKNAKHVALNRDIPVDNFCAPRV